MTTFSYRHPILTRALLLVAACGAAATASVILRTPSGDPDRVVETSSAGGVQRFDIAGLLEGIGWVTRWDPAAGELTAVRKGDTAVYFDRIPFGRLNGRVCQLPWPPSRRGTGLVLPVAALLPVLSWIGEDSSSVNTLGDSVVITIARPNQTAPAHDDTVATDSVAHPVEATQPDSPAATPLLPIDSVAVRKQVKGIIVIDPGHGGRDPGACGQGGTKEKDITLGIGLKVRDLLKARTSARVFMTRDTDTYVRLQDRTRFANQKKADFFISIHANAVPGDEKRKGEARGYKVYFLSQAKNEDDKRVAMQENAVVEMEGEAASKDYVQNIIASLTVNEYLTESQDLSIAITETFGDKIDKVGKLHQGVGQANFWVLNGTRMPAVLIETAFISNPGEEKLLSTPAFQQKMADAIVDAVVAFEKRYTGK